MVGYGQCSIKAFPDHLSLIIQLWGRGAIKQFTISYLTKVIGISES
jgi:hypothetical protein